ncbi:hypothetical protein TNCV_2857131 [Trichonephila clavipes]|nr:hypothetical protein TNCV_2857131 [Trichonephila clavipes]
MLKEKSTDLPNLVINSIKKTDMDLGDQNLVRQRLKGKTQNCNESVNNVMGIIIPNETFVEIQTLRLGTYIAIPVNSCACSITFTSKVRNRIWA